MRYADTMRAAIWINLAMMIVANTVLVVLRDVLLMRGNDWDAARGTSVHRAFSPTKYAEFYFLSLLVVFLVAGIDACVAQGFDAKAINAGAGHTWCVSRNGSGLPAACDYDNFVICSLAAIVSGGSCKEQSSLSAAAVQISLPRPRKLSAAKPPLQKRPVEAAMSGNDELFRKFVRWSREQH